MIKDVTDWSDLIEYIIQKFITSMGTRPHACASNLLARLQDCKLSETVDKNGFTKHQLDSLHRYYCQCRNAEDMVGDIIALYNINFNATKTRISVIQSLLSRNIITFAQYMSLMYMTPVLSLCRSDHDDKDLVAEAGSIAHHDSDWHDTVTMNETVDDGQSKIWKMDKIEELKGEHTCAL